MKLNTTILTASILLTALIPGVALAQAAEGSTGGSGAAEAGGSVGVSGSTGGADANATGTAAADAPQPAAATGEAVAVAPTGPTDHSAVVGTFGIGYLGMAGVNVPDAALNVALISAPVIGVRYWLRPKWGIDAGIGIGVAGSTTETEGAATDVENPQPFVMVLHGGLPLALMDSQHFVFQVIPEFNVGFGSNTLDGGAAGDVNVGAFHLDIGARAGAEIHFGFMGLPRLALQAGVGLKWQVDTWSADPDTGNKVSNSSYAFGTGWGDDPWRIFTSNVAALYYF